MKRHSLILLVITAIIMGTSCSRDTTAPMLTMSQLAGTWTMTQIAIDTNHNGKMDPQETFNPALIGQSQTYVLHADSSGTDHLVLGTTNTTNPIRWYMTDSKDLVCIENGITTQAHIDTFTVNSITLRTVTPFIGTSWGVYVKQ